MNIRRTLETTTFSNLGPFEIAVMIEEAEKQADRGSVAVLCAIWAQRAARGEVPTSPDLFRRSLERLESNTAPTVEVWA